MAVCIRKAERTDIPSLIGMMEAFYAESGYVVDQARAEASFLFIMEHPQFGAVLLAERDAAALGYLITKHYYSMGVYGFVCSIEDLFVRKDARKQGAAGRLIEAGMGLARDKGMRVFSVEVGKGNEPALALYRKYGFRNRNEDILTMECEDR
jgi:ribosomal protein S18 acetylase RimI-like enzyme